MPALTAPETPSAETHTSLPQGESNKETLHVVGIFPNDRSLIRPAARVVIEQNEWLAGKRYRSNHTLEALLNNDIEDNTRKETCELAAV
jgi:hypothetical protein